MYINNNKVLDKNQPRFIETLETADKSLKKRFGGLEALWYYYWRSEVMQHERGTGETVQTGGGNKGRRR